jgi:hypothetical protein
MSRELGFSDRVFGMGAGIFFVSYVALQVPGALLVERWSARKMISATMVAWGSLTALTAFVHTPAQLYLARAVLGAAEAGFFPDYAFLCNEPVSHASRHSNPALATWLVGKGQLDCHSLLAPHHPRDVTFPSQVLSKLDVPWFQCSRRLARALGLGDPTQAQRPAWLGNPA